MIESKNKTNTIGFPVYPIDNHGLIVYNHNFTKGMVKRDIINEILELFGNSIEKFALVSIKHKFEHGEVKSFISKYHFYSYVEKLRKNLKELTIFLPSSHDVRKEPEHLIFTTNKNPLPTKKIETLETIKDFEKLLKKRNIKENEFFKTHLTCFKRKKAISEKAFRSRVSHPVKLYKLWMVLP